MFSPFYMAKSSLLSAILIVLNVWSFGGFGLDKTFVPIFLLGFCQMVVQFVYS